MYPYYVRGCSMQILDTTVFVILIIIVVHLSHHSSAAAPAHIQTMMIMN